MGFNQSNRRSVSLALFPLRLSLSSSMAFGIETLACCFSEKKCHCSWIFFVVLVCLPFAGSSVLVLGRLLASFITYSFGVSDSLLLLLFLLSVSFVFFLSKTALSRLFRVFCDSWSFEILLSDLRKEQETVLDELSLPEAWNVSDSLQFGDLTRRYDRCAITHERTKTNARHTVEEKEGAAQWGRRCGWQAAKKRGNGAEFEAFPICQLHLSASLVALTSVPFHLHLYSCRLLFIFLTRDDST